MMKVAHALRRVYWFIFRPDTHGVKIITLFQDEVVLIKNTYGHKTWTFPGGGVHAHESSRDAAKRELEEETGIVSDNLILLSAFTWDVEYKHDTVDVYLSILEERKNLKPQESEIAEIHYCKLQELPELSLGGKRTLDLYVEYLSKKIWEYMLMHQETKSADALFLLGSNDIRLADYAAKLFHQNYVPYIVCSGGMAHQEDINNPHWNKPEAQMYKERLLALNVPLSAICIETEAKSTGDNVKNIRALIEREKIQIHSAIIIQKPFMERRAYATFRKQWPELEITVTSPKISYDLYMNSGDVSKDIFINVMVGDLIRIREYPKLGFQIEQEIPGEVWEAGQELLKLGYNKYGIKK